MLRHSEFGVTVIVVGEQMSKSLQRVRESGVDVLGLVWVGVRHRCPHWTNLVALPGRKEIVRVQEMALAIVILV